MFLVCTGCNYYRSKESFQGASSHKKTTYPQDRVNRGNSKFTAKEGSGYKQTGNSCYSSEDSTSFERHNRILILEYAKAHPNVATVKELMKTTFAMRRRDILSEGHKFDIGKYPFLQAPDHVSKIINV